MFRYYCFVFAVSCLYAFQPFLWFRTFRDGVRNFGRIYCFGNFFYRNEPGVERVHCQSGEKKNSS